jgi:pilus retraction protein PilT
MLDLQNLLNTAVEKSAADIFIISGIPISVRKDGLIMPIDDEKLLPQSAMPLIEEIYDIAKRDISVLMEAGDDDFSISLPGMSRFRVCAYKQRNSLAAVIRVVNFEIPDYKAIGIPEEVMNVARVNQKGLILVTGPAGSGKSTTLACLLNEINKTRKGHIITVEDPIEYIFRNDGCIFSQREIASDTQDYITALRASLRQAPEVIYIGEMRDFEAISAVLTAAETGHTIISTLHTVGAVNTIDRIIDVFPPQQQQQIRLQLSNLLRTVVTQQLIPDVNGKLVPAYEIMHQNNAISNLIRESKIHQIDTIIQTSVSEGMVAMDNYLLRLVKENRITKETALKKAVNREAMEKRMSR